MINLVLDMIAIQLQDRTTSKIFICDLNFTLKLPGRSIILKNETASFYPLKFDVDSWKIQSLILPVNKNEVIRLIESTIIDKDEILFEENHGSELRLKEESSDLLDLNFMVYEPIEGGTDNNVVISKEGIFILSKNLEF